tara:strand:- start:394 stop:546 length:153 start_codon:yes stop_codon:yes gene_type:complete
MKPMMSKKSVTNTDKCRKDRPMGAEVTSYASGSIKNSWNRGITKTNKRRS